MQMTCAVALRSHRELIFGDDGDEACSQQQLEQLEQLARRFCAGEAERAVAREISNDLQRLLCAHGADRDCIAGEGLGATPAASSSSDTNQQGLGQPLRRSSVFKENEQAVSLHASGLAEPRKLRQGRIETKDHAERLHHQREPLSSATGLPLSRASPSSGSGGLRGGIRGHPAAIRPHAGSSALHSPAHSRDIRASLHGEALVGTTASVSAQSPAEDFLGARTVQPEGRYQSTPERQPPEQTREVVDGGVCEEALRAQLEATLSEAAREVGTLRARCADQRERSAALESEIVASERLVEEYTAEAAAFREEMQSGNVEWPPATHSWQLREQMEAERAKLHDEKEALESVGRAILEIHSQEQIQKQAWHRECAEAKSEEMEQERSLRAKVEFRAEVQEIRAAMDACEVGLSRAREELLSEHARVQGLRRLESDHASQAMVLNTRVSHVKRLGSEAEAWRSELHAQRAAVGSLESEYEKANASLADTLARNTEASEAVSAETERLGARFEWYRVGLKLEEAAATQFQEQAVEEASLCDTLLGHVRSTGRCVAELRRERTQARRQQQLLGDLNDRALSLSEMAETAAQRAASEADAPSSASASEVECILSAVEALLHGWLRSANTGVWAPNAERENAGEKRDLLSLATKTRCTASRLRDELQALLTASESSGIEPQAPTVLNGSVKELLKALRISFSKLRARGDVCRKHGAATFAFGAQGRGDSGQGQRDTSNIDEASIQVDDRGFVVCPQRADVTNLTQRTLQEAKEIPKVHITQRSGNATAGLAGSSDVSSTSSPFVCTRDLFERQRVLSSNSSASSPIVCSRESLAHPRVLHADASASSPLVSGRASVEQLRALNVNPSESFPFVCTSDSLEGERVLSVNEPQEIKRHLAADQSSALSVEDRNTRSAWVRPIARICPTAAAPVAPSLAVSSTAAPQAPAFQPSRRAVWESASGPVRARADVRPTHVALCSQAQALPARCSSAPITQAKHAAAATPLKGLSDDLVHLHGTEAMRFGTRAVPVASTMPESWASPKPKALTYPESLESSPAGVTVASPAIRQASIDVNQSLSGLRAASVDGSQSLSGSRTASVSSPPHLPATSTFGPQGPRASVRQSATTAFGAAIIDGPLPAIGRISAESVAAPPVTIDSAPLTSAAASTAPTAEAQALVVHRRSAPSLPSAGELRQRTPPSPAVELWQRSVPFPAADARQRSSLSAATLGIEESSCSFLEGEAAAPPPAPCLGGPRPPTSAAAPCPPCAFSGPVGSFVAPAAAAHCVSNGGLDGLSMRREPLTLPQSPRCPQRNEFLESPSSPSYPMRGERLEPPESPGLSLRRARLRLDELRGALERRASSVPPPQRD